MEIKKIIAAAAAAGGLLAMWGCGEKNNSESAESPAAVQGEYVTKDELFSFDFPERFSNYIGIYSAEYEYFYSDSENSVLAGVLDMSGSHISPAGYGETIYERYDMLLTDMTCKSTDVYGRPAYIMTGSYTAGEDSQRILWHESVQYGNGDIFIVITSCPADTPDAAEKAAEEIFSTVVYSGEPEKTATEVHETEYFSISADKDWYFLSADDKSATVCRNIAANADEEYSSLKFSAEKMGATALEASEEELGRISESESYGEVSVSNGKFMGEEAVCVSCMIISDIMDLKRKTWYFERGGVCYKAQYITPPDSGDSFAETVQPVVDSIVLK